MAAILAFGKKFGVGVAEIIFRHLDTSSTAGTFGSEASDIAIIKDVEFPKEWMESRIVPGNQMLQEVIYQDTLEFCRA